MYAGMGATSYHVGRPRIASTGLRVVLVSYRSEPFAAMHDACYAAGAHVVACASGRPALADSVDLGSWLSAMSTGIPMDTDIILPASPRGLAQSVRGYEPDVMVVCGLTWKLPPDVLAIPRLGVLNVHPSALPKYRGPQPLLHAILNGDKEFGVTIHRMDKNFDTGPIIVQQLGLPLHEHVTGNNSWDQIADAISHLLPDALVRVDDGDAGAPQDDAAASYAGPPGPEFDSVDWTRTAVEVHNQVRAHRFMWPGRGPVATVDGRREMILETSLAECVGVRVDCADAPLWIVNAVPQYPHAIS